MPFMPLTPAGIKTPKYGPSIPSPNAQVQSFQTQQIPDLLTGNKPSRYKASDSNPVSLRTETSPHATALANRMQTHRTWAEKTAAINRPDQARVRTNGSYAGNYVKRLPMTGPLVNQARQLAAAAGGVRGQLINSAAGMLGIPYVLGGGGIGNRSSRGVGAQNIIGVDCSGLTSYIYGLYGVQLPRYSNHQTTVGVRTSIRNARPGDLVGWSRGGHVAIYAGNGMIIHSPQPGKTVTMRALGANESVFAVHLNIPENERLQAK